MGTRQEERAGPPVMHEINGCKVDSKVTTFTLPNTSCPVSACLPGYRSVCVLGERAGSIHIRYGPTGPRCNNELFSVPLAGCLSVCVPEASRHTECVTAEPYPCKSDTADGVTENVRQDGRVGVSGREECIETGTVPVSDLE